METSRFRSLGSESGLQGCLLQDDTRIEESPVAKHTICVREVNNILPRFVQHEQVP